MNFEDEYGTEHIMLAEIDSQTSADAITNIEYLFEKYYELKEYMKGETVDSKKVRRDSSHILGHMPDYIYDTRDVHMMKKSQPIVRNLKNILCKTYNEKKRRDEIKTYIGILEENIERYKEEMEK